jgi:hypothetical protein
MKNKKKGNFKICPWMDQRREEKRVEKEERERENGERKERLRKERGETGLE